ncbi:GroES-like protein [Phaeosphaeriaceae sp. SRC1lsM3a]|nr:GroES-like protein [Stagonospora sp. SRC1lsM3a]
MAFPNSVALTTTAVTQQQGKLTLADVEVPYLQDHQVYVKVEFAAFNPTDRLAFDLQAFEDGAVLGCDFVGTVIQTHPSVTQLNIGDRVAALVWGGEVKGLGAYSTCCIADERIAFKVPRNITLPEACAIPLAMNTAYLALFSSTSLNLPRDTSSSMPPLLVWGGSSIVGFFAIQLAKLHGYTVATTCSPQNFEHVKRAGATYVFDYNDPEVVTKLQKASPTLGHVFDTIGSIESSGTAAAAMNKSTGVFCTVRPGRIHTEGIAKSITVTDVFVFTAFPTPHTYRGTAHWPVVLENHNISAEMYNHLPRWLSDSLVFPPRVRTIGKLSPGTVLEAMQLNRVGAISAEKLYFEVSNLDKL